jgi:hypothetical protein
MSLFLSLQSCISFRWCYVLLPLKNMPQWRLCTFVFGQHFFLRGDGTCVWGMHLSSEDNDSLCSEIMLLPMEIMSLCLYRSRLSLSSFGRWEPHVWFWQNFIWPYRESWRIGKDLAFCLWHIWFGSLPVYQRTRPKFLIVSFVGREKYPR